MQEIDRARGENLVASNFFEAARIPLRARLSYFVDRSVRHFELTFA